MSIHLYYSIFLFLSTRKEICGDQFSTVHVRVLHAAGALGGYVEGFGKKGFSFWVEIFSFY
jgi:hypothetical protein